MTKTKPICGRFYLPPYPADQQFCYLPKGHKGPCKFEQRRYLKNAEQAQP